MRKTLLERKQDQERLKQRLLTQDRLLKQQQRKERTRRLIEIGGIAAKAGIESWDLTMLLGAFEYLHTQATEKQ